MDSRACQHIFIQIGGNCLFTHLRKSSKEIKLSATKAVQEYSEFTSTHQLQSFVVLGSNGSEGDVPSRAVSQGAPRTSAPLITVAARSWVAPKERDNMIKIIELKFRESDRDEILQTTH